MYEVRVSGGGRGGGGVKEGKELVCIVISEGSRGRVGGGRGSEGEGGSLYERMKEGVEEGSSDVNTCMVHTIWKGWLVL